MWRGISLANKCLLLFGTAIVLIIVAALTVPWLRMNAIVDEGQIEGSRKLMLAWERYGPPVSGPDPVELVDGAQIRLFAPDDVRRTADPFPRDALEEFQQDPLLVEHARAVWRGTGRTYQYAHPVKDDDGTITGIAVLERTSENAASQLVVNTLYLLSAGSIALGLAVFVFYWITTRLILEPVRSLKETAELVREGNLNTRSEIQTGDEFEELSETFNQMLEALVESQNQLRAINTSLDLKLNEVAEHNVVLHEANKLKGEFLANVSHELRTPLHSIIGFTELLIEISDRELEAGDDSTRLSKRRRFLKNIHTSARSLLNMINGLLELAKAEAGRLEVHVEQVAIPDAVQAMLALIRPLADQGSIELDTDVADDLPLVSTDASKLQQIIFNLLSNAVKFTAEHTGGVNDHRTARVTVRAERLPPAVPRRDPPREEAPDDPDEAVNGTQLAIPDIADAEPATQDRIRISILDTGPGIAPEHLDVIFEKFHQLDGGHTRSHEGSGLGLAICKELAVILQGEIQVESEIGRGSMFSVTLPVNYTPDQAIDQDQLARLEAAVRGRTV